MRHREKRHVAHGKTLIILFITDNKHFARNCFFTGNDLETSETLYSTSFCIKLKERIF